MDHTSRGQAAFTRHWRTLIATMCLLAAIRLSGAASLKAQQQSGTPAVTTTETMVPMRDGVHLYTQIYAPVKSREPLPILLLRTPYSTGPLDSARMAASLPE